MEAVLWLIKHVYVFSTHLVHKLILNLMEKNRFICKCISLSSVDHDAECSFF